MQVRALGAAKGVSSTLPGAGVMHVNECMNMAAGQEIAATAAEDCVDADR